MIKTLLLFFLCITSVLSTKAQNWVWAKEGTNNTASSLGELMGSATDKMSNTYCTGWTAGSVTFGTYTINAKGPLNVFIVKYDSNGTAQWAKACNGPSSRSQGYGNSTAVDTSGNLYVAGYYSDTIGFDSDTLRSVISYGNAFLVKYSPAGNAIWARDGHVASSKSRCYAYSVTTDSYNHIYIAGYFWDTVTFGPDTVIAPNKFGYGSDFLAKYDTNGNVIWVKTANTGKANSFARGTCITTDKAGNIFETGYFGDTVVYGTTKLISSISAYSVFLTKYDSSGNVLWAKAGRELYGYPYTFSYSVTTDSKGSAYITGGFKTAMAFDKDTLKSNCPGLYLVKYDKMGNVVWGKTDKVPASNTVSTTGFSVVTDKFDNLYLSGQFEDTLSFGPVKLVTPNKIDAEQGFIVKFDSSGNALCGSEFDGYNDDNNPLTVSPSGAFIYNAGDIDMPSCVFGNDTLKGQGEFAFLAKWQPCNWLLTSVNEQKASHDFSVFPNPGKGVFTITSLQGCTGDLIANVYTITGQCIYSTSVEVVNSMIKINIQGNPPGVYLCRLVKQNGEPLTSSKLVIQ